MLLACFPATHINYSLAHSLPPYKKYAAAPISKAKMPVFAPLAIPAAAAFVVCCDAADEAALAPAPAPAPALRVPVVRLGVPETEAAGGAVGSATPEGQCLCDVLALEEENC